MAARDSEHLDSVNHPDALLALSWRAPVPRWQYTTSLHWALTHLGFTRFFLPLAEHNSDFRLHANVSVFKRGFRLEQLLVKLASYAVMCHVVRLCDHVRRDPPVLGIQFLMSICKLFALLLGSCEPLLALGFVFWPHQGASGQRQASFSCKGGFYPRCPCLTATLSATVCEHEHHSRPGPGSSRLLLWRYSLRMRQNDPWQRPGSNHKVADREFSRVDWSWSPRSQRKLAPLRLGMAR